MSSNHASIDIDIFQPTQYNVQSDRKTKNHTPSRLYLAAVYAKYHSAERMSAGNLRLSNSAPKNKLIRYYGIWPPSKASYSRVGAINAVQLIGWILSITVGPELTRLGRGVLAI